MIGQESNYSKNQTNNKADESIWNHGSAYIWKHA